MSKVEFLQRIAIYCPNDNTEAMQIDYVDIDENALYGTGEESGEQYHVNIDEINFAESLFYKLVLVEYKE